MTCFNCKSPDHLIRDCPKPNNRQQNQNRQNNSLENTIEVITQALQSLLNNQNTHGYNKPKQAFYHNRPNPQSNQTSNPTTDSMTIETNTLKIKANIKGSLLTLMQLNMSPYMNQTMILNKRI